MFCSCFVVLGMEPEPSHTGQGLCPCAAPPAQVAFFVSCITRKKEEALEAEWRFRVTREVSHRGGTLRHTDTRSPAACVCGRPPCPLTLLCSCRTSPTSLSSPAAPAPAPLARPTPRAVGTGTAATPAGSAASALAGQSLAGPWSHGLPLSCLASWGCEGWRDMSDNTRGPWELRLLGLPGGVLVS